MPLHLLSRTDFARLSDTLPLSTYFNPVTNPNWYQRSQHDQARNGRVSINHLREIAKNIIANNTIDPEVCKHISHQYSGGCVDSEVFLKIIGDKLPEAYQYLIFSMGMSHQANLTNTIEIWRTYFYYPRANGYSEFSASTKTFDIRITKVDGVRTIKEEDLTAYLSGVAETLAQVDRFWTAAQNHACYTNDGYVPRIPGAIYCFMNNLQIFYPTDNMVAQSLAFDWFNTETLNNLITTQGHNFNFELRSSRQIKVDPIPIPGDRRPYERVLAYSTNILSHLKYSIRGPKEPKATMYGVELEANGDYTPKEIIAAQKELFFLMKQDSSIYGSKGQSYEFVSVPASLKAHKRLWAEFFENIDYSKFDCSKDTGNGMHVHIDRRTFSSTHLRRMVWFITNPANFEFMFAISERPNRENFQEWAAMPDHQRRQRSKHAAAINAVATNQGLRGAVHFKGTKTVEIRMFKGIVSYATIVKNLEFVDSAVEFTRETGLSQLTLRNYLAWIEKTPKNRYETLKTFLKELRMNEILASSDVLEYLWTDTNDHHVIEKMNKAPFELTNFHITHLNRRRKKRCFILEKGKIVLIKPNGGILAKIDKSVQQKQVRGAATFTLNDFAA